MATKETREERIHRLSNLINEKIDHYLIDFDALLDLFRFSQKFTNYSLRNRILINAQYEGAYQVAGYKKWEKEGAHVKKGEKAIYILAPNMTKVVVDGNKTICPLSKVTTEIKNKIKKKELEIENRIMGYRFIPVFDLGQTDMPIEKYPKHIKQFYLIGESEHYNEFLTAIHKYRESVNVNKIEKLSTEMSLQLGNTRGFFMPSNNSIYVRPDLPQLTQIKTYIHELAHSQLHHSNKESLDTPLKEYQAELTAGIVCEYYGIKASDVSTTYIKSHISDIEIKDKEKLISEVEKLCSEMTNHFDQTFEKDFNLSPQKELIQNPDKENNKTLEHSFKQEQTI